MSSPTTPARRPETSGRTAARPLRVALLTNFVSPYRRPLYEELARTEGWELRVFTNADTEFDRGWNVDTGALDVCRSRSWAFRRSIRHRRPVAFTQEVTLHVPHGLPLDLWRFAPDVVVTSELGPRTLFATLYAKLRRVPLLVWSYHSRSSALAGARSEWIKRWLLRRCDAAIGMGLQARHVLRHRGVEDARIFDVPNATDLRTLEARLRDPDGHAASRANKKRIAGHRRVALFVGNLVPRKGVGELLGAWQALPRSVRNDWRLVFVGDGPLRELLPDVEGVYAAGACPSEHMADWYSMADLHVFPTLTDVWGLVVNEASACGLPTLCSIHAACSDDMIQDGVDGLLFDPTDPLRMRDALHDALTRPDLRRLGQKARKRARLFTIKNMAEGFRKAVRAAVTGS